MSIINFKLPHTDMDSVEEMVITKSIFKMAVYQMNDRFQLLHVKMWLGLIIT